MNKKPGLLISIILFLNLQITHAGPEQAPMAVWVNEAIVATYSYNYKDYLENQKQIAKYYTANGWIAYTKKLNDSQLPQAVQKNLYYVSAVATTPPVITQINETNWKASMNLLVVYHNPQYKQKQTLKVTISFTQAPKGQGVRGYSITSLQSAVIKPPYQCPLDNSPNQ